MSSSTVSAGAQMANYNNELVKCLEELRDKRDSLNKTIQREEKTKAEIQKRMAKLQEELHRVTESLNVKTAARADFDQTIAETEAAYMKILESSQTLLHVLKREAVALVNKRPSSTGVSPSNSNSGGLLPPPSSSSFSSSSGSVGMTGFSHSRRTSAPLTGGGYDDVPHSTSSFSHPGGHPGGHPGHGGGGIPLDEEYSGALGNSGGSHLGSSYNGNTGNGIAITNTNNGRLSSSNIPSTTT